MSTPYVSITLHRAGGESVTLGAVHSTDSPLVLIEGAQGLGMAPTSHTTAGRLVGHGSILRGSRMDEREIFLPFVLDPGTGPVGYNDWLDKLSRIVSPLDRRELTLRVQPIGRDSWREIPVKYAGGLDSMGELYRGDYGSIGLRFKAFDALWRGSPVTIRQQVNPGRKPFLSATEPFFPVMLADSVIAGEIKVHVQGDAPTWPTWTVSPPGSDLTISKLATGETFQLLGLIDEVITLDMRRSRLTSPGSPDGALWDDVPPEKGAMFQLDQGSNDLQFAMVGASESSYLHLTYHPRYLRGH